MQSRLIAGAILAAGLAAGLASHAQSNVYRWVDKDGKVHFSDTPPPEEAKSVSQKRMGGYVEQSQLPYATQMAMKRNPVTLYVANDCGAPCERGRELLVQRGVPYGEKNAQTSNAAKDALVKLAGSAEVPLLLVGENKLKGYDEDAWNSALDAAGYLRTRLPGAPVAPRAPEPPPAAAPKAEPGEAPSPSGSTPQQ